MQKSAGISIHTHTHTNTVYATRMRDLTALIFSLFAGIMHMVAIRINQMRKFIATELQIATNITYNAPQLSASAANSQASSQRTRTGG